MARNDGAADVANLYARRGTAAPNFCFAGHVDVVPVGDAAAWSAGPFAAEVREGHLYGRGAADMKGAIACFAAAAARFLARAPDFAGSISLLITGDEEGPAVNDTAKVLRWMAERRERIDYCLVGEPTNPNRLGKTIKIGLRGSLNTRLVVRGVQGHSAYPELAYNPILRLIAMLAAITDELLDDGSDHFDPSTIAITTVDVGNTASTFLVHFFGSGLADERYVVERFKALANGDIRPWSGKEPAMGKGRRAKRVTTTLKAVKEIPYARAAGRPGDVLPVRVPPPHARAAGPPSPRRR